MAMQFSSLMGARRGTLGNKLARLIGLAVTLAGSDCLAATRTWTGASINDPTPANRNNFWTTAANWSGNAIPVPGDDLVFPTASLQAASQNTYGPGTSFGKITIGTHSIAGANITLTGGISATAGVTALNGIKLANLQDIIVAAGATHVISSPIDTNGQLLRVQNSGTLLITGALGGSGNLSNFLGDGLTVLTAANTLSACNALGTGTLAVTGSQPNTSINVQQGGTLAGVGSVGTISVVPNASPPGPAIAPGINSPGILNAVNSISFFDTPGVPSLLRIKLNGATVGSGYDQLNVSGTVTLRNNVQLVVTLGPGFTPNPGDRFVIVQNDGTDAISGVFQTLPEGALFSIGSATFQISYVGGDGNDITLTAMNGLASFTTANYSVNEGGGPASITLHRSGGGNTTATVGLALEDITTSPADYVSPAGKVDSSIPPDVGSAILAALLQRDGKLVIVGSFQSINGASQRGIGRVNADGTFDVSFGPHGIQTGDVRAVALQPDGKIVIGGTFTSYDGTPRGGIARLNSDGSLDTTFDPGTGIDSGGAIQTIALQPDGRMIIGGLLFTYNGTARDKIARINANGSLDTSYVPDAFNSTIFDIEIDENGKALVGGAFDQIGTTSVGRIARLNTNGSLDASFNSGGIGADSIIKAITRQPDNKIVIGGFFTHFNGTVRNRIARLGVNGGLDATFNPGTGADGQVATIAVDPAGRYVIGGGFSNYQDAPRRRIARIQANGAVDRSFDPGTGTIQAGTNSDAVTAIALPSDGAIIVCGFFAKYDGATRHNIARVQGDLTAFWGSNDFADKTILLPIVNDAVFEGNEKLNLSIVPLTAGRAAPATAELTIVENDVAPAKALNIATRLRVETGDNVMIAGFILTGNASKAVVLRGMGPVLGNFGISDFLADPVLDLRGSGGSILTNNNWKDTQRNQIEGTPFQPGDDRESVIVATLPPAAYTAILTGNNTTTGVGIIEVFDNNSAADSQLANISTRGLVQGNNSVMIGGFILGGSTSNSRIAIRGIGPSLAQFGLNNVLADPTLELHDGNGALLISNDNWESDTSSAGQLSANGLGLSDTKESGIFTSLAPGQFTAILAGKNGGTGIGLIEVYNLQ